VFTESVTPEAAAAFDAMPGARVSVGALFT
jgi:hypothetical protein